MKRFTVFRPAAPETHDANQKNPPDRPQFEGVIFSDGTCCLRWLTAKASTSVWQDFDTMSAIHGHPEYGTYFVWHDGEPAQGMEARQGGDANAAPSRSDESPVSEADAPNPSRQNISDVLIEALTPAAGDVFAERQRQIAEEGWDSAHDDEHDFGELANAAACYAVGRQISENSGNIDRDHRPIGRPLWPWEQSWWKPGHDRRRQLVKAGALILAEIERLDRDALRQAKGGEG